MVYLKFIRKNNLLEFSDGELIPFGIEFDFSGYYATSYEYPFEKLNIDKIELSHKILGYYIDGRFPYCKSKKEIYKLLKALQKQSKLNYYKENEL